MVLGFQYILGVSCSPAKGSSPLADSGLVNYTLPVFRRHTQLSALSTIPICLGSRLCGSVVLSVLSPYMPIRVLIDPVCLLMCLRVLVSSTLSGTAVFIDFLQYYAGLSCFLLSLLNHVMPSRGNTRVCSKSEFHVRSPRSPSPSCGVFPTWVQVLPS